MALDGKPELDNPLYNEDDIHKSINYAWAYGFRNPFGLNIIDDKVIVAENGVGSDQFLDIQRGKITSGMGMIGASRQTRTMSI
jgi:glucose/arabinose dehydrogenase